jgi:TonB family protein
MSTPRVATGLHLVAVTALYASLSVLSPSASIYAQQPSATLPEDTARGVEMYRKGDTKGAIETLGAVVKQRPDDADAWHYLGLSLNREGDTKAARKAFEKAVKLRPGFITARAALAYTLINAGKWRDAAREAERILPFDARNVEAHYMIGLARLNLGDLSKALKEADAALSINPSFALAFLLKSKALFSIVESEATRGKEVNKATYKRFAEAAENLEKYIALSPNDPNISSWREQLDVLKIYAGIEKQPVNERKIFKPDELTTRARILSKPEPQYTEEARMNQVSGTVVLRAVLGADGTVKYILVVRSLGHGLTEKCVEVARKIKFIPATKDGQTVSQVVQIEYNFNLY